MPEANQNPVETPGDADELRAQLDRLRDELATALDAARAAELAAGALRGELAEMRVQLARARQEQEWAMTARHVRSARWRASAASTMTRRARQPGETAASMRFSVVTTVCDPPVDVLDECLDSVRAQTHTDLEHVIVDDASSSIEIRSLLDAAARDDPRSADPSPDSRGIVAAGNDALAAATGDFVALLDHDDVLAPDASVEHAASDDVEL